MEQTGSQLIGFFALVSALSILIAVIMLMHMVQKAFARDGVLWGVISALYPPGTYVYCRKNWDILGFQFSLISILAIVGLALWLVVKYF